LISVAKKELLCSKSADFPFAFFAMENGFSQLNLAENGCCGLSWQKSFFIPIAIENGHCILIQRRVYSKVLKNVCTSFLQFQKLMLPRQLEVNTWRYKYEMVSKNDISWCVTFVTVFLSRFLTVHF
jgi:hypothetical protein